MLKSNHSPRSPRQSVVHRLKQFPRLLAARLSRRIVLWVFLNIVAIETVILIPSVYRRQQEVLTTVHAITSAKVEALSWRERTPLSEAELLSALTALIQYPNSHAKILGGALYRNGAVIGVLGQEPPMMMPSVGGDRAQNHPPKRRRTQRYNTAQGARYDAEIPLPLGYEEYALIIRHDSAAVDRETIAFIARIAGLVAIIGLFVTLGTVVVLGPLVISPIVRLRNDLRRVGDALEDREASDRFLATPVTRQDELGDVVLAFQDMVRQVSGAIAARKQAEADNRRERERAEQLLLNVLPEAIATRLKLQSDRLGLSSEDYIADQFEETTILFADIAGFTEFSSQIPACDLVQLLNQIFSGFDDLTTRYGLEKIKTIGDAYMVVGGLPSPHPHHTEAIASMALSMQQWMDSFNQQASTQLQIRVGIHTGSVVAGVIGTRKFIYDLWGDTVNIASRMESQGEPGRIQVTQSVYDCLQHRYRFELRGEIAVKGRGTMRTYWLLGQQPEPLQTDTSLPQRSLSQPVAQPNADSTTHQV
ncbi:adenylate/guanylate cyclase domain-containing protein [Leptolyngbya sp. AN02str]|uniref:adenylate/guanylate cyclase domain-containing protein n=1 Tax=Leptolyngbya sp. AN02str TaxID=3423363 RepID=UPI003D31ACC2